MTPLFFGRSDAPLYGVYHAPAGPERREGIVLCYPFGQEYLRSHRAFRRLAAQLSDSGFHVLRFDYRGTGDSSGEMEDVSPSDWLDDTIVAVTELKDMTGVDRITLVGLRLGALIAAHACMSRIGVHGLVAWDPILCGRSFREELLVEIRNTESGPVRVAGEIPAPGNFIGEDGAMHFNGFDLPAAFLRDLATFDMLASAPPRAKRMLMVVSHEAEQFDLLDAAWKAHGDYAYSYTDAPHNWRYANNDGAILLPHPILRAIADWMR